MRRTEELIAIIRRFTENENPSSSSGIKDEDIVELINEAQDRLFSALVTKTPRSFIATETIDITSGTEAYALDAGIYLDNSVIQVEWKYDANNDYVRLPPKTFHSRFTDATGYPEYYIVKNNTILLNPIPDQTKTAGIRVTYYTRPKDVDKRRGYITTASLTGTTLNSLTLTDPSTLNNRDANLDTAASDVLRDIDYITVVDKDGALVLGFIPIDDYDSATRVITVSSGFTTSVLQAAIEGNYVVGGKFATSHSEFVDNYERYILSYAKQGIFIRDGELDEVRAESIKLREFERDILDAAAKEYDTPETPLDDHWR